MQILIVEDEKRLAEALKQILTEQKYMADVVYDGVDGFEYGVSGIYDVIILDIMLPGKDGYQVAYELRKNKIDTPILMLTAKDTIPDKVSGLNSGADDYMTKPFAPEELLARIKALTRRKGEVVLDEQSFGITKVWGYDSDAGSNNVEAYISFLRRKLNFINSSTEIKAVKKMGYRLEKKQ